MDKKRKETSTRIKCRISRRLSRDSLNLKIFLLMILRHSLPKRDLTFHRCNLKTTETVNSVLVRDALS